MKLKNENFSINIYSEKEYAKIHDIGHCINEI